MTKPADSFEVVERCPLDCVTNCKVNRVILRQEEYGRKCGMLTVITTRTAFKFEESNQ